MQQNFTAENVIQFVQDNIQQNKATFWKRGIGFINLSEKDKWGILQSTGQQNWFHGLMNKIKPGVVTEYDNFEGQNDKWAGFISLAVGLQENRKIGDRCHLNYSAELNGQISNHKSMSSVGINLNGKISYLIGQDHNSLYLRINGNSQLSNNSNVGSATLAAGFKNPNGSFFEFGIVRPKGSNPNIKQDKPNIFNMKSDSLVFVQLGLLLN